MSPQKHPKTVQLINADEKLLIESINSDHDLIMVFFWEPDSLPALRIVNFVEQVADLCDDYMKVLCVNVREEQKLGLAHDIYRIPAFAFYQYGNHVDTVITTDPIRLEESIIHYIERTHQPATRISG